ncbi:MAG TPA: isoleucine--tRNA ligase [Candidatus Hodarchaeales archaeon]|nr:isoleucine--tRNA ligase [Candidatus Hodarchaeales archaeon]
MKIEEVDIDSNNGMNGHPNFVAIEEKVLKFWEENKINSLIMRSNAGKKPFVFLEGPPTANGMPHIGHALTRVIKDSFLRFQTMRGFHVTPRIGGWDCHGLPVELEVEKELGINSKEEIEAFGVGKFNDLCRKSVLKYTDQWIKMSERIGFLLDMRVDSPPPNGAYVTMSTPYIESVWWSLKSLYEKKLLFRGYKIVPYCPRCGTPLSTHEVAQGYKDTKDPSIFVKFNLADSMRKLLVWTTTPWTLISNMLLAVKEDADYVIVVQNGEQLVLVAEAAKRMFPNAKIASQLKGTDLIGMQYEPLFPYSSKLAGKKHFIVGAPFVGVEEGTGIVHIAPAFGEDDFTLCQAMEIPLYNPVDEKGIFKPEIVEYSGQFVKNADKKIMADLKIRNALFKAETIVHNYPFCWRCDSPLLYYATESWFIKMSQLRENLIFNNGRVRWQPDHLKNGRFGNFIQEAKDWSLSRSRYWGTPLPIWTCEDGHEFAVGSILELKALATNKEKLMGEIDLHRPFIDATILKCTTCGKPSKRERYVIDTWYDSGAAFFAQWHYPFENKEIFQKHFPVDFITEAIDQTRGWFYTLLAISTAEFNSPAYLNCLTMGHILAEDGNKMSKSRVNAISPSDAIGMYGADAVRYYFCSSPVWKSTRFGSTLVRESVKSFQLLLWNIVSFFKTYTRLDDWSYNPSLATPLGERSDLDRYLFSALQTTIRVYEEGMENLEIHRAMDASKTFLDDILSNWWIRRSRRRFWDRNDAQHEIAYQSMFECLEVYIRLLAPVTPFFSEHLYQEIIRPTNPYLPLSVHLCQFPQPRLEYTFPELEQTMNTARLVVQAGRTGRAAVNVKNRQPLKEAIVIVPERKLRNALTVYESLLAEELNVKAITIKESSEDLQTFRIVPDLVSIGKKFRKDAKTVVSLLEALSESQVKDIVELVRKENLFNYPLGLFEITNDDVRVKVSTREGLHAIEFSDGLLVLNLDLSDQALRNEGIVKDVIRRIQTMRREMKLAYDQKMRIVIHSTSQRLLDATRQYKSLICSETLATSLRISAKDLANGKEWEFQAFGEKLAFNIEIVAA